MITKSKWVCIARSHINRDLLTVGKVYEITTDTSICPVTDIDLSMNYFISDDGRSYIIDLRNDKEFIPLEEWRERQLYKIL